MAVECAVLGKSTATSGALERFLSGVVANVTHQSTFLPKGPRAVWTHIWFVLTMCALMHLKCILK